MKFLSDDELARLVPAERAAHRTPIPTRIVSSEEFAPSPQTPAQREVEARLLAMADTLGRHQGLSRRRFFQTAAGMAASFVALNEVYGNLFAASRADRAVFVATDWGVATQIHCLANGSPGLVHEPFWRYGGLEEIHAIQRGSGKPLLYLVRPEPAPGVGGAATRRIERDVTRSSDWVELPLDGN